MFKHTAKKNKKIERAYQILPEVYGTTLSITLVQFSHIWTFLLYFDLYPILWNGRFFWFHVLICYFNHFQLQIYNLTTMAT
jgi:hypothetical protein